MPQLTPLRAGDPQRVGQYKLTGRLAGIPSDPILIGTGPDGTEVAISMLGGDWAGDAAARDRFAAEAAAAKRVPPFCAARLLDAGVDGRDAYLVSEYIPGPSLLEHVGTEGVRRGHDLEATAIGMATGLASVHQAGLVHGSFGAEYVIMASDSSVRVVAFGITPPYGSATPAADMFAWAQAVVFAATGRAPATFGDLAVLPDHLRELAGQCLDPDPAKRPTARAVVLSLLGDAELPAGVLAEGSRRATRLGNGSTGSDLHSAVLRPSADSQAAVRPEPVRLGGQEPVRAGGQAPARHSHAGGAARRRQSAQRKPGTGPRGSTLIAALLVVAVLVAAAVVHLMQNSGSPEPAKDGTALDVRPCHSVARPTAPSASAPARGPVIPAAFAGSWSGQVRQPPTDTYAVIVTLSTAASAGTVSYSATGLRCSGALRLTQTAPRQLIMSQHILKGSCENGHVTITLAKSGSILFNFHSNGTVVASGRLRRA